MNALSPITALVIPADEQSSFVTEVLPSLTQMQNLVGGMIEPIPLLPGAVMYLNENGKYDRLPRNENAQRLATSAEAGLMAGDYIVGQVVIVGTLDENGVFDGDDHSVPKSVLSLCRDLGIAVADSLNGDPTPPAKD